MHKGDKSRGSRGKARSSSSSSSSTSSSSGDGPSSVTTTSVLSYGYTYGAAAYGAAGAAAAAAAWANAAYYGAALAYGSHDASSSHAAYPSYDNRAAWPASAGGGMPQAPCAGGPPGSGRPAAGSKGDYGSLLEEMKAKQGRRETQKRMREEITQCGGDQERAAALERQLRMVQYDCWRRGEACEEGSEVDRGQSCESEPHVFDRPRSLSDAERHSLGARHIENTTERVAASAISGALASVVKRQAAKGEKQEASLPNVEFRDKAMKPLRPEQVAAVAAHLKHVGGSDRVSRLFTVFGVARAQLAEHFVLFEHQGQLKAKALPSQARLPAAGARASDELCELSTELEEHLRRLTPGRLAVGRAMVFFLERGSQQAAPLARGLIRSLEEAELHTEIVIARLFLISDVLHNSGTCTHGAARYRTSFQELLPDAFERLGRQWFRRLKQGQREHVRAEAVVRRVLATWKGWDLFTPLFTQGLEALLFAPVLDAGAPDAERDEALRLKLTRWCLTANAARLPYAARLRGLSGSALATTSCRARLCHFDRYWYRPGFVAVDFDDDPWGDSLRPAPTVSAQVALASLSGDADDIDGDPVSEDIDGVPMELADIDGEELSESDFDGEAVWDEAELYKAAWAARQPLRTPLICGMASDAAGAVPISKRRRSADANAGVRCI